MGFSLLDFAKYYFPHYSPKPMSHAAEVKQHDAKAETRLLKLLGQDTDWLYQLRYDNGLAWLKQHYGFDPRLEHTLATMPGTDGAERNLFWAWWLNDWQHRDYVLSQALTVLKTGEASYYAGQGVTKLLKGRPDLAALYHEHHTPKALQIRLPGFVLDAAKKHLRTALPEK